MLVYKISAGEFGAKPFLILTPDKLADLDAIINPCTPDCPWGESDADGERYCLELVSMTQEEIDALPGFDGFC